MIQLDEALQIIERTGERWLEADHRESVGVVRIDAEPQRRGASDVGLHGCE
jgi:hypothetical protein